MKSIFFLADPQKRLFVNPLWICHCYLGGGGGGGEAVRFGRSGVGGSKWIEEGVERCVSTGGGGGGLICYCSYHSEYNGMHFPHQPDGHKFT